MSSYTQQNQQVNYSNDYSNYGVGSVESSYQGTYNINSINSTYQTDYNQSAKDYTGYTGNYQSQTTYQEDAQRPYSESVREYLDVVGKVFMSYANHSDYTVTEAEVPSLLTDTYSVL